MQLQQWLEINQISSRRFAKQIGKNPSLVHKYLYEDVTPKLESMQTIYKATYGVVTANDFYKLTPHLLNYNQHKKNDIYAEQ